MVEIEDKGQMWSGMKVKFITFKKQEINPRYAFGRAIIIDQEQCEIQIYPFYDKINANFGKDLTKGVCPWGANLNLGATVQDFIEGLRHESAPNGVYASEIKRCLYASNCIQTDFVLPNGFLIHNQQLICKPEQYDAMGLDCDQFFPLHGVYTALIFDTPNPHIAQIKFEQGKIVHPTILPRLAMYGPALIQNGENVADTIEYRPNPYSKEPFDLDLNNPRHQKILKLPQGFTQGCEVNYPPATTMTSFTAFGIREDKRIVMIAMFEGFRGQGMGKNLGINIYELADILVEHLGVTQAILGGGGADTQQFLRGARPEYLIGPMRTRPQGQEIRSEVIGPRGLSAIITVLVR